MKKNCSEINNGFINFLNESSSPFHAVKEMRKILESNGYQKLCEKEEWKLSSGQKYFVERNGSALIAFSLAQKNHKDAPTRMVGGHTDSPVLRIKPLPDMYSSNCMTLAVEPYGGSILPTWFDRDLSIAGKVAYQTRSGEIKTTLVDFKRPVAIVASLAIHLDRQVNEGRAINKQKDLPPIVMLTDTSKKSFKELLKEEMEKNSNIIDIEDIFDFDLNLYDTQKAQFIGMNNELIAGGKIDNLLSCYVGLEALLQADGSTNAVLVCNDHEECGSTSSVGADGFFLKSVLIRIFGGGESLIRACSNGVMISCDNAHAVHPNFSDKHEGNHRPLLNAGPVLKINTNMRYATECEGAALFQKYAKKANVPVQKFVARSDLGCGSTIGPITSSQLGVRTVDVGVPTLGMHSIRELMGDKDGHALYAVLVEFLKKD